MREAWRSQGTSHEQPMGCNWPKDIFYLTWTVFKILTDFRIKRLLHEVIGFPPLFKLEIWLAGLTFLQEARVTSWLPLWMMHGFPVYTEPPAPQLFPSPHAYYLSCSVMFDFETLPDLDCLRLLGNKTQQRSKYLPTPTLIVWPSQVCGLEQHYPSLEKGVK